MTWKFILATIGGLIGLFVGAGTGIVGGMFGGIAGAGLFIAAGAVIGFLLPANFKGRTRR